MAGAHAADSEHLLRDPAAERKGQFSLQQSLERARQRPLLAGRACYVGENTKPDLATLTEIVQSCGGQVRRRALGS